MAEKRINYPPDDGLYRPEAPSSTNTADFPESTTSNSENVENHIKGEDDTLNERFELKKRIGSGNKGIVYKALDRRKMEAVARDPYVAVKILKRKFSDHDGWLNALQRKVQKCQHLVHPNIGRVYDFNRDGPTVYVTMEYLYGEPLACKMQADDFAGISLGQAQPIIEAMGRALACAHERDVIHYDFKPSNVFFTDTGEIKVTDFFIAPANRNSQHIEPQHFSETAEIGIQNPAYASPEMLEELDPDPRDDIFAFACITFELLTGRHPFDGMLATQAREKRIEPTAPKALKARQWKALKKALTFDRGERTASIERLLADFKIKTRTKQYGLFVTAAIAAVPAAMAAFGITYFFSKLNTPTVSDFSKFENPQTFERTQNERTYAQSPRTEDQPAVSQPTNQIATDSLAYEQAVSAQPNQGSAGPVQTDPSNKNILLPMVAMSPDDVSTGQVQEKIEPVATLTKPPLLEEHTPGQTEFESTTEEGQVQDKLEAMEKVEIQLLLTDLKARAEQQMAAKKFTTPVGDSAFESYQQILELVPGHEGALQGIENIKAQYQVRAETAMQNGELKKARVYLARAIVIAPEDPNLIEALSKLSKLKSPGEDALSNAADQPLKTPNLDTIEQDEQVLGNLLQKAQQQLEARQLVRPENDNAAKTFSEVLQIDPANRSAREGLQAIAIQLEAMARAKQQKGDLRASLSIVDAGLQVLPDHTSLRALRDALNRQIAESTKAPRKAEEPAQKQKQRRIKSFATF